MLGIAATSTATECINYNITLHRNVLPLFQCFCLLGKWNVTAIQVMHKQINSKNETHGINTGHDRKGKKTISRYGPFKC
jgi:hypothetical protein